MASGIPAPEYDVGNTPDRARRGDTTATAITRFGENLARAETRIEGLQQQQETGLNFIKSGLDEIKAELRAIRADRESDRRELTSTLTALKDELKSLTKEVSDDLKSFKATDFKELQGDVVKLRLNWAKVAALGVLLSAVVGLAIEYLKKRVFHI